ncbi:MAG: hypothetical protein AAFX87_30995 [Bacteroidota bacterium]
MVKLYTALLLVLIAFNAAAQLSDSVSTSSLDVRTGWRHYLLNDEIGSNLNYAGSSAPIFLAYSKSKKARLREWQLIYDAPTLSNTFNESFLDGAFVLIQYGQLFKTSWLSKKNLSVQLGGNLKSVLFVRNFNVVRSGFDNTTGESASSLNLHGRLIKSFNAKHTFVYDLQIALVGYVYGTQFNGSGTGDLLTLDTLTDISNSLSYQIRLGDVVDFLVQYNFRYYQHQRVNTVEYGTQEILAGLKFKFK